MFIIYEAESKKIVCWAEEGVDAIYPIPGIGQVETRLDCTVEEFERACRESSGEWDYIGVGPNYLHDTVEDATKSTKTSKKGKKVGHRAVECEHPDNVQRGKKAVADVIEATRKAKGQSLDEPITIAELRAAEKEVG